MELSSLVIGVHEVPLVSVQGDLLHPVWVAPEVVNLLHSARRVADALLDGQEALACAQTCPASQPSATRVRLRRRLLLLGRMRPNMRRLLGAAHSVLG